MPVSSTTDISLTIEPGALPSVEAAKYIGVSTQTLANWRSLGKGPRYARLGGNSGRIVYRVVDLDAFLEQNLVAV